MNQGSHQTICSVVGLHPILLISGGGDWYDTVCLLEVMTTTTVSSTQAALFHSLIWDCAGCESDAIQVTSKFNKCCHPFIFPTPLMTE